MDPKVKEELDRREADVKKREDSLQLQETGRKHADNLSFAEGLVAAGKLLPANKAAVVGVLDFAAGVTEGDTIEFGEGETKKTEAPLDTIKALFGSYPKIIEFGELAPGDGHPGRRKEDIPGDIAKFI